MNEMPTTRKKTPRKRPTANSKRPVGRPPKFSTAEELDDAVNAFFKSLRPRGKPPEPPTLSGLMLHLDFADYKVLHDYEKKPKFSQVLKKARMRVLQAHERHLFATSCTGSIFYLKCHGGEMFKESAQQHEHSGLGGGPITVKIDWGEDEEDGS